MRARKGKKKWWVTFISRTEVAQKSFYSSQSQVLPVMPSQALFWIESATLKLNRDSFISRQYGCHGKKSTVRNVLHVSQSSLFQTITSCHFTCSSTEVILLFHSCFVWLKHCAQHGIVGTLEVTRIHKQHPWRFSVWNTQYFCRICSTLDIRTAPQQHWCRFLQIQPLEYLSFEKHAAC